MKEHELDTLFDAARAVPPEVPQELAERVLEDALIASTTAPQGAGWREWIAVLGGKRGLGGLITATCVGFWIGVAPPQALPDLAGLMLGEAVISTTENESSLFGWDIEEG